MDEERQKGCKRGKVYKIQNGEIKTKEEEIMRQWKKYFEKLLNK